MALIGYTGVDIKTPVHHSISDLFSAYRATITDLVVLWNSGSCQFINGCFSFLEISNLVCFVGGVNCPSYCGVRVYMVYGC